VVSEFAKIISLSLRLYGNIYGEHEVSHIFSTLWEVWGVPIPLQAPILLLAILTSTIQALVFTILTAIYLSLMTAHGPEAHEPAEAGAH
jgi:F-type H+-transporting ATPase subunit a